MERNEDFILIPKSTFDKLGDLYTTVSTSYFYELKRGLGVQKVLLSRLSAEIEDVIETNPSLADRLNPLLDGLFTMNDWIEEKRRCNSIADLDSTIMEIKRTSQPP